MTLGTISYKICLDGKEHGQSTTLVRGKTQGKHKAPESASELTPRWWGGRCLERPRDIIFGHGWTTMRQGTKMDKVLISCSLVDYKACCYIHYRHGHPVPDEAPLKSLSKWSRPPSSMPHRENVRKIVILGWWLKLRKHVLRNEIT